VSIDPRRLLVFREVGRTGSLAAAARALGFTQPAVSQHVHRLERDLGLPLIARTGRGSVLTGPGRVLMHHAEAVAGQLAAATEAMSDLAGLRAGRVRVAAFPSASATLVAAAVASVTAAHPTLDVRLTQVEPEEAAELQARGQCEIAVTFAYPGTDHADPVPPDAEPVFLLRDHLFAVLPADHPLGGGAPLSLADLAGERWIAGCPRCSHHLARSAADAGFTPDIRHRTDDYVVVQSMVAAGAAVAVLPQLALTASRHPAVRVVPLAHDPYRVVTASVTATTAGVPAAAALLDHLRRAAGAIQRHPSRPATGAGAAP
jgi:DNA-binding transcriptional LysR family regulator